MASEEPYYLVNTTQLFLLGEGRFNAGSRSSVVKVMIQVPGPVDSGIDQRSEQYSDMKRPTLNQTEIVTCNIRA